MGMLIIVVMPFFDGIEWQTFQFVLIPIAGVGVAMFTLGKFREWEG